MLVDRLWHTITAMSSYGDHPKNERTLVIIKPDGIQRGLINEIIKRYEQIGLKLVGMKMMIPTPELIEKHYTLDPEWRIKTGLKAIKGYESKGKKVGYLDGDTDFLRKVTPVYKTFPGWQQDISKIRKFLDLPQKAQAYIKYIEKYLGVPVKYVSVGARREETIIR